MDAYVSAEQKRKLFEMAGFQVRMIVDTGGQGALLAKIASCEMFVRQRPFVSPSSVRIETGAVDLDSLGPGGMSAVAEAVARILEAAPRLDQRSTAVVGSRGQVGSQVVHWLRDRGIQPREYDLGDSLDDLAASDVIVSAVGVPGLIGLDEIDSPFLGVDVGFTYDEKSGLGHGDFTPGTCARTCYHTPVPGGLGPLQTVTLLERALAHLGDVAYLPWRVELLDNFSEGGRC